MPGSACLSLPQEPFRSGTTTARNGGTAGTQPLFGGAFDSFRVATEHRRGPFAPVEQDAGPKGTTVIGRSGSAGNGRVALRSIPAGFPKYVLEC